MKEDKLLQHDPLSDADAILSEDFYGRVSPQRRLWNGSGERRASNACKARKE